MPKQLVTTYEGPNGEAEVYEVNEPSPDRPQIERIRYEVVFNGESQYLSTMGEASVVAGSLTGDPRFSGFVQSDH